MFKKFVTLIAVFFIGLILVTPVMAEDTEIKNMTIHVEIDNTGQAYIKETWEMSVYEGTEVYKVLDNMNESVVSRLKVTDDTGKTYTNIGNWDVDLDFDEKANKCGIVQDGDYYELCFGIGEYGERTYTFEYQISHFIKQYDDIQGLNYAFLSDMNLDIDHLLVVVSSPYDFDNENSQIWAFGYEGKVYYEDGNIILENSQPISGEKVQLLMRIDESLFKNNFENKGDFQKVLDQALDDSEYDKDAYMQDGYYTAFPYKSNDEIIILVIIFTLCGFGAVGALMFSYYSKSKKIAQYRFDDNIDYVEKNELYRGIPCQSDLFEIHYLAKKAGITTSQQDHLISAIMLKWVQEHVVTIEKQGHQEFLTFHRDQFHAYHSLEKNLFDIFMEIVEPEQSISQKNFEKRCQKEYSDFENWYHSVDSIVETMYKQKGLLYIEKSQGKWLGKTITKARQVLSGKLRVEMEKISGLKNYLRAYEEDHAEFEQNEEYAIYATLLDVREQYEEQIEMYYPNDYAHSYLFHSSIIIHSVTGKMVDNSSSSSSSITGGGSSFSGGGGGGVR